MPDQQLVKRAIARDPEAIQAVLEGLQEHAWFIARDFTRNWDEVEDLAQEILIEVSRSLTRLRDPDHLESWCITLGRRVCLAWKKKEKRRELTLGDLHIEEESEDPSIAPHPFPAPDRDLLAAEQRDLLRSALKRISLQSRQILELFYLDELSLREIASQLDLPENAIKQRLHWGRRRLEKEMWTMPMTTERRQQPVVEPLLRFSSWGSWSGKDSSHNPWNLTRLLLAPQILLCIARESKTEEELIAQVGAEQIYIRDHLTALEEAELIRPEGKGFIADFFILNREIQDRQTEFKRKKGRQEAEIIAAHLDEVRDAVERCGFEERGFGWDFMRWIVLPVFAGNLGVRRAYPEVFDIQPPLRPDGNRWFFFGIAANGPPEQAGDWCKMSSDNLGGVGSFGTPFLPKLTCSLPDSEGRKAIHSLVKRPRPVDDVIREIGGEDGRTKIAELIEAGLLANEEGMLHLTVPVFTEKEDGILHPVVAPICQKIVEHSRKKGATELKNMLDSMGFNRLQNQYPAMYGLFLSGISHGCVAAMVEMGLLGTPSTDMDRMWGWWVWQGKSRLVSD